MTLDMSGNQALALWLATLRTAVRGDTPDLSSRQMAILLTVFRDPPPHTVRRLAAELNISKPAVSRALNRLCALGFVRRKVDSTDRRSILVQRALKGAMFLTEFGELVAETARSLDGIHPDQQAPEREAAVK